MQSVREFISEIRENCNRLGMDTFLPGKYIHHKAIGIASLFIKREADDKRLSRYTNLWTPIKVEMEEKPLFEVCDVFIPNCKTVMVSKRKLPDIYTSRVGYLIQVTSDDLDRDYTPTTPKGYKNAITKEYVDKRKRYCWIENDRLIIPDSMVREVRVNAMFINRAEALRMENPDECISFLDQIFIVPEHISDNVKDKLTQNLIQRPAPDEYTNLNENEKDKGR